MNTSLRSLTFILFAALSLTAWADSRTQIADAAEKRIALVIGNSAYPGAPLKNPVNDARAIAAKLKSLGFEVIQRENVTLREMSRAITQFGERLGRGGTAGLGYYAGHGMQVRGKNFLIPVDAQITGETSVRSETIDVDTILEQLNNSPLNIVILDACRNNPFERRFRSVGGGLAQMDAPKGTLIAYATAPGKVASDGTGSNGLYTAELLKVLGEPNLKVEEVFKKTRVNVARATTDQQIPWEASSLTGDFYFRSGTKSQPSGARLESARVQAPDEIEQDFWNRIRDSQDAADFETYLKHYPQGRFVAEASLMARKLKPAQQASIKPEASGSGTPRTPGRAILGVSIQDVTEENAKAFGLPQASGALVVEVAKGGPAEAAGIAAGDIILKFNDQPIIKASDLPPLVGTSNAGAEVAIQAWRNGATKDFSAKLAAPPKEQRQRLSR